MAQYTVMPLQCAPYFNKIQCFCFKEQILKPKERVDMPVFFYIDPDILSDPETRNATDISLSYVFCRTYC